MFVRLTEVADDPAKGGPTPKLVNVSAIREVCVTSRGEDDGKVLMVWLGDDLRPRTFLPVDPTGKTNSHQV